MLYLGLDIGGTKSTVLLGDAQGHIHARHEIPSLAHRGPGPMLDDLLHHAHTLVAASPEKPLAVGVSIGGPLDARNGLVLSPPNLPGWDNIPLRTLLSERLHLPVAIAHDAAACALAEFTWGKSATGDTFQNTPRLAYLTCGTGFGVGLIIDGKIYYGGQGQSVEIGHVRYRDTGPDAYGKPGCFESYCAGSSLPKLAAFLFPQRWAATPPTAQQLATLAANHDPDATEILTTNARAVGAACALLADLFAPNLILLGSLARYLGPTWLDQVHAQFQSEALPSLAATCRIQPASLGDQLQDLSALVVATTATL